MSHTELSFMPPLNYATRGTVPYKKKPGALCQVPLQHSVITFGSPHVASTRSSFDAHIEGNRTGELRVIDSRAQLRSDDNDFAAEHKKNQQLALELQRALEKLRLKNKEELKLRRKAAVAKLKLEEEVERRMSCLDAAFELVQMYGKFVHATNTEHRRLLQLATADCNNAHRRLKEEGEVKKQQEEVNEKANALRAENENLRRGLEELRGIKIKLEESCKKLQEEKEDHEANSLKTKQQLELDLMRTQALLQGTNRELKETKDSMKASDALMQQVRLFIQMVCQPDFYVVKDRSLEPVDKNRPEPTGFVLVPLRVLLQGYTLLSPGERQNVIESYGAHLR